MDGLVEVVSRSGDGNAVSWWTMSGKPEYRGIQYSVEPLGARRWRWLVTPPNCVLGLSPQEGEIEGERGDADRAAKAAIQSQSLLSDARQAD